MHVVVEALSLCTSMVEGALVCSTIDIVRNFSVVCCMCALWHLGTFPLFPPNLYSRMEGFTPDASYRNFENSLDQIAGQPSTTTEREVPLRYKTKGKSSEEKERLREARRTRRTVRLEQEQQKKREKVSEDTHYKISYSSSSEESSVDENYDVTSIAESEVESLT